MIFRVSSGGLLVWGHFGSLACMVLVLLGELCPGAPCWQHNRAGGGSVARDTASPLNGLQGSRSASVLKQPGK